MQLRPGDLVDDKYRIIRPLGRGGMGSVFVVEHMIVGRTMAMKVLHSWTDERDIERFKREARAATKIGSPHIVNVHDLGQLSDGTPYMVMEHLRGETLAQRLKARGTLGPTELAPIAVQMLEGLGAAHRIGIIHRDLKPDNVFLAHSRASAAEDVKLLDFGVALSSTSTNGAHRLTRTGVVVGTPSYMSPEQACADQDLDARTDLYAVGVILYRALSGRLPFEAENMRSLMAKIIMGKAAPLSSLVPDADRAWAALITKAMARRPEDRFQSAAEFQQAVNEWINGLGRHDASEASNTVPLNGPDPDPSEYQAVGSASPGAPPVRGLALRAIVLSAAALGVFAGALAVRLRRQRLDRNRLAPTAANWLGNLPGPRTKSPVPAKYCMLRDGPSWPSRRIFEVTADFVRGPGQHAADLDRKGSSFSIGARKRLTVGASSWLSRRHVCYWEVSTSSTAPYFYENLGLQQVP